MFNMWPFLVLNALNGVKNLMQHKGLIYLNILLDLDS